jgi:hypothetical protein
LVSVPSRTSSSIRIVRDRSEYATRRVHQRRIEAHDLGAGHEEMPHKKRDETLNIPYPTIVIREAETHSETFLSSYRHLSLCPAFTYGYSTMSLSDIESDLTEISSEDEYVPKKQTPRKKKTKPEYRVRLQWPLILKP